MPETPEEKARRNMDRQLEAGSWKVQDRKDADPGAALGVAIREFPLKGGEEADYLLYADGKAIGAVEAKSDSLGHARGSFGLHGKVHTARRTKHHQERLR